MSVRPHTQQDQIKPRKFAGCHGKKLSQRLLVDVCDLRGVRVLSRDGEDVSGRNRHLRQERFLRHAIVAVRTIRGNMAFISPEKEHLTPGQGGAGVGCDQGVQVSGSRSAGERNREAPALRDGIGRTTDDFLGGRLKKILRSRQSAHLNRRTHSTPTRPLLDFVAAHRAAPSNPALSLVMTCTGISSSSALNLPFSRKARMNKGPVSLERTFGEIPPPRKMPPVAMVLRARLPASAP